MKKLFTALLMALIGFGALWAQSPTTPCDITITGNFDSECIYDYKVYWNSEYPDLMIACKHSTVTYTAHTNNGGATPIGYIWEVFGDASHTAVGNQVTVTWGDDDWGIVVVNTVNSAGDTCTEYSRVKLIDNPTVGCITVPAYTVTPAGDKVVRVCKGSTVQFIDNSTAEGSDIAGYNWSCSQASPSSTPGYVIENVTMSDAVTHTVHNNCGCHDSETILIEMLDGETLELECFGTVCEGATVNYYATAPSCNEYHWYVEGGTIVSGQGTDKPTVQWDSPAGGYGVIGLDGVLCGGLACPAMLSRRVPVIQDGLPIEGESDVCLGEAVLYTLPLLGSTEYQWSVSPITGVDTAMKNNSNELWLVFNQPGTFTVRCTYRCGFLGCGPYTADSMVITVKPVLAITGDERICVANACNLQTSPAVSAQWTAYDMTSGNTVAATATGATFSHTFGHAGRYLITAENASYCGPATFVLNVADLPPAPTVADLNPDNRHTACPYSGIALNGTPSDPSYSLVWAPACSTAAPQTFCGDSVTISYQANVCNVLVYNYDRVLQCRSATPYVHQVLPLMPEPLNIPSPITVCPGSLIVWGDVEVPDQSREAMLYEWTMDHNKQYCASVVGSHLDNGVTLAVNETNPLTSFYVNLERKWCGGNTADTAILITVTSADTCTLHISGPDTVCVHSTALFTGSGCDTATYRWAAEDELGGDTTTFSHTFMREGIHPVTLTGGRYTYCTNPEYLNRASHVVVVAPLPVVEGLSVDPSTGTIVLVPTLSVTDYDIVWTYRYMAQSPEQPVAFDLNSITAQNPGTYICTVTDRQTNCTRVVSTYYDGVPGSVGCNNMTLTGVYNVCENTLSLTASQYSPYVAWTVTGGSHSIATSGTGDRHAEITFDNIGTYTIEASSGLINCYKGRRVQTVDFIPDFEFVPACDRVLIRNHSQYALPGGTVYMTVTARAPLNTTEYIEMPVDDTVAEYTPNAFTGVCTLTFTLTGYVVNGNITPCVLGTAEIGIVTMPPNFNPVSITTSNPVNNGHTCDNTPIMLTASLNYSGASISATEWYFSDGSEYKTSGNSVYHTFKSYRQYYVTVTTTDNHGCQTISQPVSITSYSTPFTGSLLYPQPPIACPFANSIDVLFSPHSPYNNYEWWRLKDQTHVVHSNPYQAYQPDDYFVHVTNENYCQTEASTFVPFLNAPTARIYVEKTGCCVGETVILYGGQDPGGDQVTYVWTVSGPSGFSQTENTPNITLVPPTAGSYNVQLTVTGSSGCSSTASITVTASTPAPAPTLSFVGSPCISDAPVVLSASGCSGEVHWSNGATASQAIYFTPGEATAYCYDPAVGCPSQTAQIVIDRQPDFDALLTGCYEKCGDFFDNSLPVYGLTGFGRTIKWKWLKDGLPIDNGNDEYYHHPLLLPLTGAGSYRLSVDYSNNMCNSISPTLTISSKKLCDCDSVSVSCTVTNVVNSYCRLSYEIMVVVCNESKIKKFCCGKLELVQDATANASISTTDFTPTIISYGECETFHITVNVNSLVPSTATFKLFDNECMLCEKEFSVDLMPQLDDCVTELTLKNFIIKKDMSNAVAAYFSFDLDISPCGNLLGLWSEPPMIVDYLPAGSTVSCLGMIDMAVLSQLVDGNEDVCFHAVICCDGRLCHQEVCIPASILLNLIQDALAKEGDETRDYIRISPRPDGGDIPAIQLTPNPTTGMAEVTGTADEVAEITLMDMNGRKVTVFEETDIIDISGLPSGAYIARITTRNTSTAPERERNIKVSYVKLVKK